MGPIKFLALFLILPSFVYCSTNLDVIELKTIQLSAISNSTSVRSSVATSSTFYISDIQVNWRDALKLCSERGKRLVTITTSSIDRDVQYLLSNRGSFSVWTAGNDLRKLNEYRWETTNAIVGYSQWREPPYSSKFQGCISVAHKGACSQIGAYGWDKEDCASFRFALCH